jgi:hypothetical protein
MEALAANDIVPLWERGQALRAEERAFALLAAASPELDDAEVEALTIGAREQRLLQLWELTFGPRLDGFAECPACAEPLEFPLETSGLRSEPVASRTLIVRSGDWEVSCRPLTCGDLREAARQSSRDDARRTLLERSVLRARRHGRAAEPAELPEDVVALVSDRLEAADPQAEIRIQLACPACATRWSSLFDVAAFLWAEVNIEAKRLLLEVHTLASAYGWRESEILGLSPARRRFYLECAA